MKNFTLCFLLLCAATAFGAPADTAWSGPLEIRKGGVYTGFYKSTNPGVAAITISTTEKVEIKNCVIAGSGQSIVKMYSGTNVYFHHNKVYGLTPNDQWGKAINNYAPQSFVCENNNFEHTGGLVIDRWSGGSSGQLKIRFNKIKDTDRRRANGTPGYITAGIQLNTIRGVPGIEIAWNELINTPNASWVEDNINIYNSSGTATSPIRIHNNYIFGALPVPAHATSYSGSGITVDGSNVDGATFENTSAYIEAYENQVLATANAAMNIAIGHHVKYYNNRMVSAAMLADGTKLTNFWAGCSIFNGSNLPASVFFGNSIENNVIGYTSWGRNYPYFNRQDENNIRSSTQNLMPPGRNTYLPGPITLESEKQEWQLWQKKLADKGIVVGMGGTSTAPEPAPAPAPAPSVPAGCGTGTIAREVWNNVGGSAIADIPLASAPSARTTLSLFETPSNTGESYASRIRGYICAPLSGNYTFWIAGDDATELWLSTTENPAYKVRIAYSASWTSTRSWDQYATQKSAQVYLQAGQKYYVEALHKEAAGGDHLSVAWQLPNGLQEAPIPGNRLSPYQAAALQNQTISFAAPAGKTYGDAPFTLSATATSGLPVSFRIVSGPATLSGNTVTLTGTGTVSIEAAQAGNTIYNAAAPVTQNVTVAAPAASVPASTCSGLGSILREQWTGTGGAIADIALTTAPSSTTQLTVFETAVNSGDHYGSRIRGYICPPVSGNYTFWIAGDDAIELWLSTSDNPANKTRIAYNNSWTIFRNWNQYPSQKSAQVYLQAGQKYYIEALHKEGAGGDHLSVAWQLPGGQMEAPIPGNRLAPFAGTASTVTKQNQTISFASLPDRSIGETFSLSATATSGLPVSFRVVSGPATLSGQSVTLTGTGTVSIEAAQAGNTTYNAAPAVRQSFTVGQSASSSTTTCSATGSIEWEMWSNVKGWEVSSVPVHTAPSRTETMTLFEAPSTVTDNYGARMRGYICAPMTGNYTFWIAGDNSAELYLSTTDNPQNKVEIASVAVSGITGTVQPRQWNLYGSQKSVHIYLVAGRRYYIEALYKENIGQDHLAVAWQLPNGVLEAPISGNRLSPYQDGQLSRAAGTNDLQVSLAGAAGGTSLLATFPNPVQDAATVQATAAETGMASISVYNLEGRMVQQLFSGNLTKGIRQQFTLRMGNQPAGTYFVRLVTQNTVTNNQIVVLQ